MSNLIDLTGKRFGYWTVLERDYNTQKKNIYWVCRCNCGTVRSVAGTSLRSGISVSCGCEKDKLTAMRGRQAVDDITGQRFGMWTVLRKDDSETTTSKRGARWICRCDCGKEKSVLGYALRFGRTSSCGCQNGKSSIVDITGQKFGKLTVIKQDDSDYDRTDGIKWICKCECGNTVSILGSRLRSGVTRSCGCIRRKPHHYSEDIAIGSQFGQWTVLDKDPTKKRKSYICKCSCGTIRSVAIDALLRGISKSCGCSKTAPKVDLTGKRFGKLTVLGVDEEYTGKGIYWKCQCDCGTIKSYRTNLLRNGKVVSCGCESRRVTSQRRFEDLTGKRFGRLTVIGIDHKETDAGDNPHIYWKCQCDCGNTAVVVTSSLKVGFTQSCGCLQAEASALRAKDRTIDLTGHKYGLLTIIERVDDPNKEGSSLWRCICDCGNEKLVEGHNLRSGLVASCGCLKQSKYELFVLQYFEEKGYESGIDFEPQKRFDDLRGYDEGKLSYDFSVIKNGRIYALIECQGQQHYKPVEMFGGEEQFAKQQLHDEVKRKYADKLGVILIEIPYTVVKYEEVKTILEEHGI